LGLNNPDVPTSAGILAAEVQAIVMSSEMDAVPKTTGEEPKLSSPAACHAFVTLGSIDNCRPTEGRVG